MGKISIYLKPETENKLLDRIMEISKLCLKDVTTSAVVDKHLEYALNHSVSEVMM